MNDRSKNRVTQFGLFPHEADKRMRPKINSEGVFDMYEEPNIWYAMIDYISRGYNGNTTN